ncbi:crossover junction endodeoxyribonuclease RuvC [Alkalihalobacillus pseudalcaliphilus]|uniref:crossover junction endodeoxyribonuclease RuvC n=1 Tax=Alkalihalobacillus pseudalcaliphilus TaxID=79884 RepID=UPI00069FC272|nr:crossover junction endodeoxyribonuclease RuvC [Alkalihalobacillus pseudalcaliphilus]
MRVLALDLSTKPGFAVLDAKKLKSGVKLTLVHCSSAKTSTDHPDAQRYAYLAAKLTAIIHEYGPFDVVTREHFTKGRNKRATQTIFGVWGTADVALGQYGYVIEPANEIPPSEVKKAATGSGTASKEEVEIGVRKWLGLSDDYVFETDDESDAVAVGLAWLIREGHIEREA